MAENVKRRVAAARLAVAFAAAGAIAGATWAQADPPPPTAQSSASDYLLKANTVKTEAIVNGSLLFKDFKKGQVPSALQFNKLQRGLNTFKKATNDSLATLKTQIDGIKGELGSYVKLADADSRYIKLSDSVVRGDGSVFTASLPTPNQTAQLLSVPGLLTVDVTPNGFVFTNASGEPLGHSDCGGGDGTLPAGQSLSCPTGGGSTESIQFFSWGREISATVSFSRVNDGQQEQNIAQILIGL